ncbi:alpha/beta hydrolase [Litoribrevibacter albus]|uniref:Serine aminopeptidase S33 domain-containing protein n=1 Tax=Litoribrevibacter albus TaxID=1473156 RepID=A0AA37W897_9GAMM|nr:alpha/beta hydrolase [Litoribrevibacter albus]GLQ33610.1 hypothetical protein GCM10007876_40900 [Litoribrevibacter albus]
MNSATQNATPSMNASATFTESTSRNKYDQQPGHSRAEHQWFSHIEDYITQQRQPAPFIWAGKTVRAVNMVSTRAAGKLAHKIWFTPQNRPISEADHSWLKSASQELLSYKCQAIPLYQWGAGPTVLTVHGWGGHSGQFRQMTQALVKAGYRVLSFDAPGHGLAEGNTTNAEEISEIIQMIARHQTIAGIISHSIGGLSSHHAINNGAKAGFHAVLNTPMCLTHIVHTFKHQLSLPSEVIDQHNALMEKKFGPDFWPNYDLRNQSKPIPQFFSYDDQDHQVSPEVGKTLQSHFPEADFVFTQQLGHNKAVRTPEIIEAVKAFIQKNQ